MPTPFSDAVKAVQTARGSRRGYAKVEARGGFAKRLSPDLIGWLAEQTTSYLATASVDGQPYIQHRGGPPGFLRALDDHTLAWADYAGNRQYISTGNLAENAKACLFVMDYAHKQRVKLWGTARVVTDDPALAKALTPADYAAWVEQVIVFDVQMWDGNCPQHIPDVPVFTDEGYDRGNETR